MFRKARRVISAVIQYVFMAFPSYWVVLARLRGLIHQAALLWNARGLVAIAALVPTSFTPVRTDADLLQRREPLAAPTL
jgi:hypothetical protein